MKMMYRDLQDGEILSRKEMIAKGREEYDLDDPTNVLDYEEYFEEVNDDE